MGSKPQSNDNTVPIARLRILRTSRASSGSGQPPAPRRLRNLQHKPLVGKDGQPLLANRRVLVVEDDPISAKLALVMLRAEGCDVRVVESAESALSSFGVFDPQIIVLDLVLPMMSGLLLAEALKRNPSTADIPLVAVTSLNGPETQRLALEAGCSICLLKPLDSRTFPLVIAEKLGLEVGDV